MRKYQVTLTGKTPLLMHSDNLDWADQMNEWKDDAANRKDSKAGDDRTPAWRWIGSMYHNDEVVVLPSDNLARSMMEGGAMVPVPGGKSGKTFKAQSQSGMMCVEPCWPLLVNGKAIAVKPILAMIGDKSFAAQKAIAQKHGFLLFTKRAKIGSSKHIRVRPRFDGWSAVGTVLVWDDQITESVLRDIMTYAGQYKGLGDWRPGGRTPGPHGMFSAEVKAL